ncbi:hypothetical protein P7K49_036183 [Saguinus oedipus]|uniref:Uncharacterized protein n=1 Tax=Saguinus oedipus TaxID=9490 RepID=A0ABQ9TJJ6_SAGOE|nr:hypothetical protein P7K49_036183 [Saguinus oedipus]
MQPWAHLAQPTGKQEQHPEKEERVRGVAFAVFAFAGASTATGATCKEEKKAVGARFQAPDTAQKDSDWKPKASVLNSEEAMVRCLPSTLAAQSLVRALGFSQRPPDQLGYMEQDSFGPQYRQL